jgi:ABC-2 type transport system ATP-binding protein
MTSNAIVSVTDLSHSYAGGRPALSKVNFQVNPGEFYGFLGPNGSGKTTLFRILNTLIRPQSGQVTIGGIDIARNPEKVRPALGVVFQAPSLDRKLTVLENIKHQGHLYGLSGVALRERAQLLLTRLGVAERANELVENLSGGLQRRVEIVKAMLPAPSILLMDEPSTGLDPAARRELWIFLRLLQRESPLTVLLTTHLMEEAEQCHRLLLLDDGAVVCCETPAALKGRVPGTVLWIKTMAPEAFLEKLAVKMGWPGSVIEGQVRLTWSAAAGESPVEWTRRVLHDFSAEVEAITLAQPTLEDAFVQLTGRAWPQGRGS